MNILLLVPPDTLSIESSVPDQLEKRKEFRQRLGLLSVAAHLETLGDIRPQFLDISVLGNTYAILEKELSQLEQVDVVGMSLLTFNMLDARRTARIVRSHLPGARIVGGGHHATLYPEETLRLPEFDFVVCGEGERVFTSLVQALAEHAGRPGPEILDGIGGLGWKDETGNARFNPNKDQGIDFDALPPPAHHLVDLSKYNNVLAQQAHVASIQSSRGCPAACTFCDIRKTKFRTRSPENVVDELEKLVQLGTKDFFLVDDTFTIDKRRSIAICDLIVERNLDIGFKVSSRVDTINPETLAALKKAGCYRIHYGIESTTPRLLDYLQKGVTNDKVRRAVKWTRDAGIQIYAYMMIGIPTETRREMLASVDYAIDLKVDYAQFSILTPYPKTELYRQMLADGIVDHDYWQEFAENPQEGFRIRFWNRDFTEDQLREIQDQCMKRFYGRRAYILQELRRIDSFGEFMAKARVGARVLLPGVMRTFDRSVNHWRESSFSRKHQAPDDSALAGIADPS